MASNILGNAGGGAATGAALGSVIPGVGTAIGGAVGAVGGLLGGLFGSGDQIKSLNVGPATDTESMALWGSGGQNQTFQDFGSLVSRGPGAIDVTRGLASQRELANLLKSYIQSGGLPDSQDQSQANGFAGQVFAGQRQMLNQQFQQQDIDSQKLAARLGRSADDPVLRAKLLQAHSLMFNQLAADQTSYGAQLGLSMADRRVGFAQGQAQVNQGLAQQAMQNRASLLGLGSQIVQNERNFRLGAAGSTTTMTGSMGQGIGGAVAGLGLGAQIGGMFGGGGGIQQLALPQAAGAAPAQQGGFNFGSLA